MFDDYQGMLEDFNTVHVLDPNNASTLKSRENVKCMLDDSQGALENLDKADVL